MDFESVKVDSTTYERICLHLSSLARYLPQSDCTKAIEVAYKIYIEYRDFARALQMALFLDKLEYVDNILQKCDNFVQKIQFCYIIARHDVLLKIVIGKHCSSERERDMLQHIMDNKHLGYEYLESARVMEFTEAKTPSEIYKVHLLDDRGRNYASKDTIHANLGAIYINAFVNAGFSQDGLGLVEHSNLGNWLDKFDENEWSSVLASLGMIYLWDFPKTVKIIKFVEGQYDDHTRGGALLAVAIIKSGIKFLNDPVWNFEHHGKEMIATILGMGLYYAGTCKQEMKEKLTTILKDEASPLDVVVFASISLGLVFVGSCDSQVSEELVHLCQQILVNPAWEKDHLTRLLPLSLGLVYLGKQKNVDECDCVSSDGDVNIKKYIDMTLASCAYAGTGNVLKVQEFMLQLGGENEKDEYVGPAVLGLAMVAMDENVGIEMCTRLLNRLLEYGGLSIRRAVPFALSLLYISDPKVDVTKTLSKLTHADENPDVVRAAIISLGLIGAGTNNARIDGLLRNLSSVYCKDESIAFCVRIAQGFLYMGKGLLTLAPYHCDRFLMRRIGLAGLIAFLHACLTTMGDTILGNYHYIIYYLVLAVQPRMLITVDDCLTHLSVPVLVGQAVDVAGEPGRPRTITGFDTHYTPVILHAGERAELATEEYESLSPFLEGLVILRRKDQSHGKL